MPALLTRMSSGPSAASTRATPAWQAAKSATFHRKTGMPVRVANSSAARAFEPKVQATRQPATRRASAIAAPMPDVPPVTSAVRCRDAAEEEDEGAWTASATELEGMVESFAGYGVGFDDRARGMPGA
jgi:hypothetical protein